MQVAKWGSDSSDESRSAEKRLKNCITKIKNRSVISFTKVVGERNIYPGLKLDRD